MTNYQLGATILGVLKAAGYGKHVELIELLATERIEDPSESWLHDILPADRVPMELALQTLEWATLSLENEAYKESNNIIEIVERYQNSLLKANATLAQELKSVMGHDPSSGEVASLMEHQEAKVEARKLRQKKLFSLSLEINSQRVKADISRREAKESPYDRQIREWKQTDEYREWKRKSEFEGKRLNDDMQRFRAWIILNDPNRGSKE